MKIPTYPKIETLFARDEKFRVIPDRFRCREFEVVNSWHVEEKIDGTNIRVALRPDDTVFVGGRTDDAQMAPALYDCLRATFPADRLMPAFREKGNPLAVLFGEGYGPKIQKGGGYSDRIRFRLFDVLIVNDEGRWWLARQDVATIAMRLGVEHAPLLGISLTTEQAVEMVRGRSCIDDEGGTGCDREGIIARADPLLLDRMGHRVMWKLKAKDFA